MTESDPTGRKPTDPGAKLDANKTRWDLVPWEVIEGVAEVMTFGANKYSKNGWKCVPEGRDRYFAAMMRHYVAMRDNKHLDPDSKLHHWKHFVTNAVFIGYFMVCSTD